MGEPPALSVQGRGQCFSDLEGFRLGRWKLFTAGFRGRVPETSLEPSTPSGEGDAGQPRLYWRQCPKGARKRTLRPWGEESFIEGEKGTRASAVGSLGYRASLKGVQVLSALGFWVEGRLKLQGLRFECFQL